MHQKKALIQRLMGVHSLVGVGITLFMYVAVFFGIFAILLPFIQVWEKPSRHFAMPSNLQDVNYGAMIDSVLLDPTYPQINGIKIFLPGAMLDPALRISTQFVPTKVFNPNTLQEVQNEAESSQLASFLNGMHYGRPFKLFGFILFGLVAVAAMFLIVSGLWLVQKVHYSNSSKTLFAFYLKGHRKIFTWLFVPFIIITLTGALMNIGYSASSPMSYLVSKGETSETWKLVGPVLFPTQKRIQKAHEPAPMLSINALLSQARVHMPEVNVHTLTLFNWGDKSAYVKVEGYNPTMPFLNGISNLPSVTLSGVDATLIAQHEVLDKHWSGLFYDAIFFLHFLFGVDGLTRFVMVIIMLLSLVALGCGMLFYLEKQSKSFESEIPYHWLGRLSLSVMVGVIPAVALLFFLQWLFPFEMEGRFFWQKSAFSLFWIATLTWSFYRLESYRVAKEFLMLGGVLFFLTPLVHMYNSGFSPSQLWNERMFLILGVDSVLALLGVLLLGVARALPQNKEAMHFLLKRIFK